MASGHDLEYTAAAIIGKGANRVCVRDRTDVNVCLKIDLPKHEKTVKNLSQKLRRELSDRVLIFNENYIEWSAHQQLLQRLEPELLHQYFAACLGLERVEKKLALRCELVRSDGGEIASSIYHYIHQQQPLDQAKLLAELDAFEAWLIQHDIPLFDLNSGNIVIQHIGQELKIKCIDIKSTLRSKEIIPVSYWSKTLMHRKIKRRMGRLKALVQQKIQQKMT